MKRYNLSRIMKDAWNTYKKYSYGRTFGECLKEAWEIEKDVFNLMNGSNTRVEKKVEVIPSVKSESVRDYDFEKRDLELAKKYGKDAFYNSNSMYKGMRYCGD